MRHDRNALHELDSSAQRALELASINWRRVRETRPIKEHATQLEGLNELIVNARRAGVSVERLARFFGVTIETIRRRAKE